MQGSTLVKLLIVGIIALAIWKKGIPWWKEQQARKASTAAVTSANESCVSTAERASEVWGSGLREFINPPFDLAAWEDFRSRTQQAIESAEQKCTCGEKSCATARQAMSELRALIFDMDGSIRSGSPPPAGAVQRQEAVDNALESARDLVRQGQ
jgi:hypothetical protein